MSDKHPKRVKDCPIQATPPTEEGRDLNAIFAPSRPSSGNTVQQSPESREQTEGFEAGRRGSENLQTKPFGTIAAASQPTSNRAFSNKTEMSSMIGEFQSQSRVRPALQQQMLAAAQSPPTIIQAATINAISSSLSEIPGDSASSVLLRKNALHENSTRTLPKDDAEQGHETGHGEKRKPFNINDAFEKETISSPASIKKSPMGKRKAIGRSDRHVGAVAGGKLPPLASTAGDFFPFDVSVMEPSIFRENEAPVDRVKQSLRATYASAKASLKADELESIGAAATSNVTENEAPADRIKQSLREEQAPAQARLKADDEPESTGAAISHDRYDRDLPPIMVPPSVMAGEHGQHFSSPPTKTRRKKKKRMDSAQETPQQALENILIARGYGDNLRISAAQESIYETIPTALQLASFGKAVFKAVQQSDTDSLSKFFKAGLSPNPCNQFRDSVLDLVCKRGNSQVFQCMLDHQTDLRVCDNFGRTPLHHACWGTSTFASSTILCSKEKLVYTILKRDWQQIIMQDHRGQTPLEYVHPDQYGEWVDFLQLYANELFPPGNVIDMNVKDQRPYQALPDPPHALPLPLASALSAGKITPADAVAQCAIFFHSRTATNHTS